MLKPDDEPAIPLEEFLARYLEPILPPPPPPPRPRVRRRPGVTIVSLQGGPRGLLTPFSRRFAQP